jgi:hypothetical protein
MIDVKNKTPITYMIRYLNIKHSRHPCLKTTISEMLARCSLIPALEVPQPVALPTFPITRHQHKNRNVPLNYIRTFSCILVNKATDYLLHRYRYNSDMSTVHSECSQVRRRTGELCGLVAEKTR